MLFLLSSPESDPLSNLSHEVPLLRHLLRLRLSTLLLRDGNCSSFSFVVGVVAVGGRGTGGGRRVLVVVVILHGGGGALNSVDDGGGGGGHFGRGDDGARI